MTAALREDGWRAWAAVLLLTIPYERWWRLTLLRCNDARRRVGVWADGINDWWQKAGFQHQRSLCGVECSSVRARFALFHDAIITAAPPHRALTARRVRRVNMRVASRSAQAASQ